MTDPADRGAFIWYELITDDVAAARTFYRNVVGWEIAAEGQPLPTGGTYRMIARSDGGNAGGVLDMSAEMTAAGARPGWIGYVHHSDVDAAVKAVIDAGGAVHMPPMDMPGVGRMAMVADPQGATFYVMAPTPPEGDPDARSDVFDYAKAQHMRWNELWTTDPDAAVSLYRDLFGWTQEGAMPMGPMGDYKFIQHGGDGIGAIAKAQPGGEGSRWQYFAGVDDIDRACRAVTDSGGTLLGEPQQIPGGEYSAYAHDPSGATIGLVGPRKET
ncbi:VOC family protein [Tsuneonella amylolytica]|uniref:VOC family protein n=1 Tax=Tsuneonella amylolytica TaxID=2338327 RepID=UPI000EAA0A57|nr:VOC family protein [Tsuneonella amylolytica]